MQLTYSNDRALAVPGLLSNNRMDNYIVGKYTAGEILEPGRLVVLNSSNQLIHPQATDFVLPVVGVVVFQVTAMQPAIPAAGFTYAIGAMVPILRRGNIWADVSSTAEPTELVRAKVKHSSTIATHRGKFCTDAVAAGAGVEIDLAGPVQFVKKATTVLWEMELNFPGT